jgi:hypothetical protein
MSAKSLSDVAVAREDELTFVERDVGLLLAAVTPSVFEIETDSDDENNDAAVPFVSLLREGVEDDDDDDGVPCEDALALPPLTPPPPPPLLEGLLVADEFFFSDDE